MSLDGLEVLAEVLAVALMPSLLICLALFGQWLVRRARVWRGERAEIELGECNALEGVSVLLIEALTTERARLLSCLPKAVPDQLRVIERGLVAFDHLPKTERRGLEQRGFELTPVRAKLDLALSHGGLMARSQLLELDAMLAALAERLVVGDPKPSSR